MRKTSIIRKLTFLVTAILLIGLAAGLTGTISAQSPSPSASAAASPSGSPLATLPPGSSVEVLGVWGSTEQASFQAMVAPWSQQTGGQMKFTGTRDLTAILTTRIQSGNPPDVAILPNPGLVKQYATANNLKPLNPMLNLPTIQQQYSSQWLGLGTVNSNLYALPIKATNKGIIWYNPKTFSTNSWQVPKTWDEMITLSNTIVSAAKTPANPWSVGVEAGQASGFPATDWIAQIFLTKYGGSAYDQWVAHQIPWTDPKIKDAWNMFGAIINTPNYVAGGSAAVLATNFQPASFLPFQSPPKAAMYYEGDFVQGFITAQFPNLVAGQDYNFFPFPSISATASGAATGTASPSAGASPSASAAPSASPSAMAAPSGSASASGTAMPSGSAAAGGTPLMATAVTGGADLITAFKDTPAVRSFIAYLSTPQAQEIWAKRGGYTSVNSAVNLSVYPDAISKQSAQLLVSAPLFRFGAGDIMPAALQTAWWAATLQYIQNPGSLDSLLSNLESTAATAYAGSTPAGSASPSATAGTPAASAASPSAAPSMSPSSTP